MPKKKKSDTSKIVSTALDVLNDVARITLGTKKNGDPRSIIDAQIEMEKARRKTKKRLR